LKRRRSHRLSRSYGPIAYKRNRPRRACDTTTAVPGRYRGGYRHPG